MSKLMGQKTIDVTYDEHDPNLVKRRQADISRMYNYLSVPLINVKEGIRITCQELYDKVDKWQSHNV